MFLVVFIASCEQKKKEEVLKPKIPLPAIPEDEPEVDEKKEVKEDSEKEKEEEVAKPTAPYFEMSFPTEITIKENEAWSMQLSAVDPDGGTISFYTICPYLCPDGINFSDSGLVEWRPSYAQANVYDIQFTATDESGEYVVSPNVRFIIQNENRPPRLTSVMIKPDKITAPAFLTCDVTREDDDKDLLTTLRTWIVNGEENASLKDRRTVESSNFRARDEIYCASKVVDANGAETALVNSEVYIFPNTAPSVNSISISKVAGSGASNVIYVGNSISCSYSASDENGDDVVLVKSFVQKKVGASWSTINSSTSSDPYIYTVDKNEAHSDIRCGIEVTDGTENTEAFSTSMAVTNSAPTINSVTIAVSGGKTTPSSGDTASCTVSFSDVDGDVVSPSVSFYNSGTLRSGATTFYSDSVSMVKNYILKTIYSVANPIDADTNGDTVSCVATLTDGRGGVTTTASINSLTLGDTPPTLIKDPTSTGNLAQTLYTGQSMTTVKLLAKDMDGDVMTVSKVNDSDTCDDVGIILSVAGSNVTMMAPVPSATHPQKDRDCSVKFKVTTSNPTPAFPVGSDEVTFSLTMPNRSPTLVCTNKTQFLETAPESYKRLRIGQDGEVMSDVVCTITDADDPSGDANYDFVFTDVGGSCSDSFFSFEESSGSYLLPFTSLGTPVPNKRVIKGNMGLDFCSFSISAADGDTGDGGRATNVETVVIKPKIDINVLTDVAHAVDSSCRLSLVVDGDRPIYNFTDNSINYSSANSPNVGEVAINTITASSIITKEHSVSGVLSQEQMEAGYNASCSLIDSLDLNSACFLQTYPLEKVNLSLVLKAYSPTPSPFTTTRTVKIETEIKPSNIVSTTYSAVRPFPVLGRGAEDGSQTQATTGCIRDASCDGVRASVSAGGQHSCVLSGTSGSTSIACWGDNTYGQLGFETAPSASPFKFFEPSSSPSFVSGLNSPSLVTAGKNHTCAIVDGGKVKCWGANGFGQLGTGSYSRNTNSATTEEGSFDSNDEPLVSYVTVDTDSSDLTGVVSLSTGDNHTCALTSSGTVYCWGSNNKGQIGNGDTSVPASHDSSICFSQALYDAGSKDKTYKCATRATKVVDRSSGLQTEASGVISISLGGDASCGIFSGGKVACWGSNENGLLGGGAGDDRPSPFKDALSGICDGADVCPLAEINTSTLKDLWSISVGSKSACAIDSDGAGYCWGKNDLGQFGNGETSNSTYYNPELSTKIFTSRKISAITVGNDFSCITEEMDSNDGIGLYSSTKCFGENTEKLGYGSYPPVSPSSSPLPITVRAENGVDPMYGVMAISAGNGHACGVKGGEVYCWGDNSKGQLGSSIVTESNKPIKVFDLTTAAKRYCSQEFVFMRKD